MAASRFGKPAAASWKSSITPDEWTEHHQSVGLPAGCKAGKSYSPPQLLAPASHFSTSPLNIDNWNNLISPPTDFLHASILGDLQQGSEPFSCLLLLPRQKSTVTINTANLTNGCLMNQSLQRSPTSMTPGKPRHPVGRIDPSPTWLAHDNETQHIMNA